jgi:hypothetical protein
MDYRPLDHKYKTIFKSKRNWEKLIDGWDVKFDGDKIWGSILTRMICGNFEVPT